MTILYPPRTAQQPRGLRQRMRSTNTSTNNTKTALWRKSSRIFACRISVCWPPRSGRNVAYCSEISKQKIGESIDILMHPQKEIGGLDILVDDVAIMCVLECGCRLLYEISNFCDGERHATRALT